MNRTVLKAMLPLMLVAFVGYAYAGPGFVPKLCHNIGGPDELGANCDGATGECSFELEDGTIVTVPLNFFLGIIIGTNSEGAFAAHLAHGDGPIVSTFDPPLHLASTGQTHKASNVECLGQRLITTQPPEPGN